MFINLMSHDHIKWDRFHLVQSSGEVRCRKSPQGNSRIYKNSTTTRASQEPPGKFACPENGKSGFMLMYFITYYRYVLFILFYAECE